MRLCRFSSVRSGSRPSNDGASRSRKAAKASSIGISPVVDAEVDGEVLGVGPRAVARVARRHGDAVDVVGAERVGRDAGHQRRVDAAGQPDHDVGEAVLRRRSRGCRARAPRRPRRPGRGPGRPRARAAACVTTGLLGDHDLGERLGGDPAARVEQPLAEHRPHVEVDDEELLAELRRRGRRSSPSASTTSEAPSKTSSSWPPTWFT